MAPVLYRFVGSAMAPQKMQAVRSVGFLLSALAVLLLAPAGDFWPGAVPLAVLAVCTIVDLGVGDTLYFLCVTRVGAGRASALTNTYPLYVVLFSWLILGEGLSLLGLLGVVSVVAGLILLCLFKEPGTEDNAYARQPIAAGLLPGILAGMCWSTSQVMMRWIYAHTAIGASSLMFWRSVALLVYAWAAYLRWRRKSGDALPLLPLNSSRGLVMLAAGALILTLPGWLVALALKNVPASAVAPVTGASPAVAALLGRLLYHEAITPLQWLGIVMIISGGAAVNLL
jgi:drug/metabolite transporter (DMT)-like permease